MNSPLEGVRVLDFTRVLAGPFCTMMLGDMGAEIVKVEDPAKGDDTRAWGPPFQGDQATYFLSVNRNKKSITLNLKSPSGLDIARRLAARSDILLENFRPGTMDRLGLGYAELSKTNPKLVYASITGYGQTGPLRDLPGYDAVAQGEGGLMSLTGFPDGPPTKAGLSIADLVAGMYACQGILLALRVAEKTGQGQQIDVSLLDGQVALLSFQAQGYFATGKIPHRRGNQHSMITPYETYQTADGHVIIAVGTEAMWKRFCGVCGLPQDGEFQQKFASSALRVQQRDELAALLEPVIASRTTGEWIRLLQEAQIPCGKVRNVAEVLADPQVLHRQMVEEVEHPSLGKLKTVGVPVKLSATPGRIRSAAPNLGQHNSEVLESLGFSSGEIECFRREKAI